MYVIRPCVFTLCCHAVPTDSEQTASTLLAVLWLCDISCSNVVDSGAVFVLHIKLVVGVEVTLMLLRPHRVYV